MTVLSGATGRVGVIQPLAGIGDMIWFLPLLRGLAQSVPGQRFTLITKPKSQARHLFAGDPMFESILWIDRKPGGRRGAHEGIAGLFALASALRRERFQRIYVLHHSWRYACAAMLAGVPERYGYGFGRQRWFLNRPPHLDPSTRHGSTIDRVRAFGAAFGIPASEPRLAIDASAREAVAQRFADRPHPWMALGVGASEPFKQWEANRFGALANALIERGWRSIFLIGAKAEAASADAILRNTKKDGPLVPVFDLSLDQVAALLASCRCFIGNDSGLLNMSAAVGIPSLGIFGGTAVLTHSALIHAVTPPDGRISREDGMRRIAVDAVLDAFARMKVSPA